MTTWAARMRFVLVGAFVAGAVAAFGLINVAWAANTHRPGPGRSGVVGGRTGTWAAATPRLLATVGTWAAEDPRLVPLQQLGLVVRLRRCTPVHVVDAPRGPLDRVRSIFGYEDSSPLQTRTMWLARDALLPNNRAADCGCRTRR